MSSSERTLSMSNGVCLWARRGAELTALAWPKADQCRARPQLAGKDVPTYDARLGLRRAPNVRHLPICRGQRGSCRMEWTQDGDGNVMYFGEATVWCD